MGLRVTFPIKFRYAVFLLSDIQAGDDGLIKLWLRETFPIKFRYAVLLLSNIQAGDDGCVKVEMTVALSWG